MMGSDVHLHAECIDLLLDFDCSTGSHVRVQDFSASVQGKPIGHLYICDVIVVVSRRLALFTTPSPLTWSKFDTIMLRTGDLH